MVKGGGFLFIDAKIDADTRDSLYYLAKACGRQDEFYILNPDDPENSNTYNPILNGDADEVASRLLNLQPSSEDNPGADFYRQSANHALTVIIGALKVCNKRYTFADLAILLQSADAMEKLFKDTPESPERMALDIFLDKYRRRDPKMGAVLDINKMKDVLGGMAGRIAMFAQGKFGRVFNTYAPEIDLTDIMKNNKMMYCMLPTMGKDTAALNLGKMIMSDIRSAVYNLQNMPAAMRPWPPFLIFPDEMGSYVMEGIARLFEQARSAQVCLMPGFQAFGNLKAVSDQFADIIIQNTWSKVYYRFGSQDSAEMASEMMGKATRYIRSVSRGETEGESAQFLRASPQSAESEGGSRSESWREDEVNRVTPDHLGALPIGQAVVTIGPKVYHIQVPRLTTPIDKEEKGEERKPELIAKPMRFPTWIPKGESGLDYAKRYESFMMAAGIEATQPKDSGVEIKSRERKRPSSHAA
jgi:type IV secretory pathway TraG/TraD family ATPase VirD4